MVSAEKTHVKKPAAQKSGRPQAGYWLDGQRLPGVTTVVGRIDGDTGGLLYWAWNLGMEGLDHRKESSRAAAEGTKIHDAAGELLQGRPKDEIMAEHPGFTEVLNHGLNAMQEWVDGSRLTSISAYEQPIISPTLRIGGTPDFVARDEHECLHLIELKTGSLRPAAVLQVAAYAALMEEAGPDPVYACHLLRLDRATGAFTHIRIPQDIVEEAQDAVRDCARLHEFNKRLKKML